MSPRMQLIAAAVIAAITSSARGARALDIQDPGEKGPYEVGFTVLMLVDESRPSDGAKRADGSPYPARPIPLFVWYPADPASVAGMPEAVYPLDAVAGRVPAASSSLFETYGTDGAYAEPPMSSDAPFPLLVFSPGSGAPPFYHVSLGTRLASHGFVVAVPYHWGSGFWGWERKYDVQSGLDGFQRPRDLSFVLSELLDAPPGHLLHGAIRPDQVASGGWSLGGYTAMALAGGDDLVCDVLSNPAPETCEPSRPDPRFRAIVSMDGAASYLHWSELSRVTVPSLVMGREWSTLAAIAAQGGPQASYVTTWVARPHGAFRGHPNVRVDILGSNHQSFSDFCQLIAVFRDLGIITPAYYANRYALFCAGVTEWNEVHRLMGLYSIAFLRTALTGDPGFDHLLTPGWALTREPLAEAFVTEKRSPNAAEDECISGPVSCPDPQLFLYFPHQPGREQARAEKDPAGPPSLDREVAE